MLWCNDRLQRSGWENSYFCPMSMRNLKSSITYSRTAILSWSLAKNHPMVVMRLPQPCCLNWGKLIHRPNPHGARQNAGLGAQEDQNYVDHGHLADLVGEKVWSFRKVCSLTTSVIAAIQRDNELWRLAGACWGSLQKLKFSTHHQDQSMEFTSNERGVHLHTFEDRDAEVLQERGRWSRTRSDSDRGRNRF